MTTPNYVLDTQDKVTAYLAHLSDNLELNNQDLRSLGPSKRLHRHAEALGFDNWQQMLAKLQYNEFVSTMTDEYGVSEAYADAAWHTLKSQACNPNYPTSAAELARNYCSRFNIKKKVVIDDTDTNSLPDAKLVRDAQNHYSDIIDALNDGNDEFFEDAIFGSVVASIDVTFTLSSNTALHLKVDASDMEPISGYIRTGGFGEPAIVHLNNEQLEKVGSQMLFPIQTTVSSFAGGDHE